MSLERLNLHVFFLVPGLLFTLSLCALAFVIDSQTTTAFVQSQPAFFVLLATIVAYPSGVLLYGVHYYGAAYERRRSERTKFLQSYLEEHAPLRALLANRVPCLLSDTSTPIQYPVFEFMRSYVLAHGSRQLCDRIAFAWELYRLTVTLLNALLACAIVLVAGSAVAVFTSLSLAASLLGGAVFTLVMSIAVLHQRRSRDKLYILALLYGFLASALPAQHPEADSQQESPT